MTLLASRSHLTRTTLVGGETAIPRCRCMAREAAEHRSPNGLGVLLLAMVLGGVALACAWTPGAASSGTPAGRPRFELSLSYAEFALLHDAARAGVERYGGDADLRVRLVRNGSDVVWKVEIDNEKLIEVMDYWMAERVSSLVAQTNFSTDLSDSARAVLELARTTHAKVRQARQSPLYDVTTLTGALLHRNGQWMLQSSGAAVDLSLDTSRVQPEIFGSREVIATGVIRTAGTLDVITLRDTKPKTLELFVMSMCPFARQTEDQVIRRYVNEGRAAGLKLEVHYIFYSAAVGASADATCMHGEPELQENLVQMSIRDNYPSRFLGYLELRAESDEPWQGLARKAGLSRTQVEAIGNRIRTQRSQLVSAEHDYVASKCGVLDGSPTIMWEARRVSALTDVPLFADASLESGKCESSN